MPYKLVVVVQNLEKSWDYGMLLMGCFWQEGMMVFIAFLQSLE